MKAQVSVEYMLVVSFIMLVIIPGGYLFSQYAQRSSTSIADAQLTRTGNAIVTTAERMFYAGEPSRSSFDAKLPSGVRNITVSSSWEKNANELVLHVSRRDSFQEYVFPSGVNINTSVLMQGVPKGMHRFHLEAYRMPDDTPFVMVDVGGRCPASLIFDLNGDGDADCTDQPTVLACDGAVRPAGIWQGDWYSCIRADYNGDCRVTAPGEDLQLFQNRLGRVCP